MKVKELIEMLQYKNPEMEIRIAQDNEGYYEIEYLEELEDDDGEKVISIWGDGL